MALAVPQARGADAASIDRGKYLFAAGGCLTCHTDLKAKAPPLSGGAALKTPFGDFYAPNITPSKTHGIGNWSDADFKRAMRDGVSPGGSYYFPAFPYPTFTNITDADLADLKAYIFSLPAVETPSKAHEVSAPFSWRFLQLGWRMLYFDEGPFDAERSPSPQAATSAEVGRGAYLVEALVHCGECHTPRGALGGIDRDMWLAGTEDGPEGSVAPNITPDSETGIGKWSTGEIVDYLRIGMMPDGDFAGSLMADVVTNATGKLNDADLKAIAAYLKSIPAIRHKLARSK